MRFEGFPESINSTERVVDERDSGVSVLSPEVSRHIEINNLDQEIASKEELHSEILSAAVQEPEATEKGKTPSDLDLGFLKPDEAKERNRFLHEKYDGVLEQIQPIGKKLEMEGRYEVKNGQEIGYDNLVFVRADDFPPTVDQWGNLTILNPEDATDKKVPRITSHFTLNHRVSGNSGGAWENKPYQFVVPGGTRAATHSSPFGNPREKENNVSIYKRPPISRCSAT